MKTKATFSLTVIILIWGSLFVGTVSSQGKLEKELIVRSEAHQELCMMLKKEFEKLHPGTEVIITNMDSSVSFKKSFSERRLYFDIG